jgi:hypothetical protein
MRHSETTVTLEGIKSLLPFVMVILSIVGVYYQLNLKLELNSQKLDDLAKKVDNRDSITLSERKEMSYVKDSLIGRVIVLEQCVRSFCK